MPYQVSADIAAQIIELTDYKTQVTCLRVSKTFLEIAGKHVYRQVVISYNHPFEDIFMGWDEPFQVDPAADGTDSTPVTPKPNFKRQLLEKIKFLVIRDHRCPPLDGTDAEVRIEATQLAINVERVIMDRWVGSSCEGHRGSYICQVAYTDGRNEVCPILKGLGDKCRKATVHSVGWDGPPVNANPGPLHELDPIIDRLEQLTMVIPPTGCIFMPEDHDFGSTEYRTQKLYSATQHIPSIRIIIGGNQSTSMTRGTTTDDLGLLTINYLSRFIESHTAAIEIFVFGYRETLPFNAKRFRKSLIETISKRRVKSDAAENQDRPSSSLKDKDSEDKRTKVSVVGGIREYYRAYGPVPQEMARKWCEWFGDLWLGCLDNDAVYKKSHPEVDLDDDYESESSEAEAE